MKRVLASLLFAPASAAQPSFEAASIKPNLSGSGDSHANTTDGFLDMRNVSLPMIVEEAYNLKHHTLTAPDWDGCPALRH